MLKVPNKAFKTLLASCILQIIFVGSILMASLLKVSRVRNKDGRGAEMAEAAKWPFKVKLNTCVV